jgi:hypothetical protein
MMSDFSFLPPEFDGWRRAGETLLYDRETIFDYIDGAGEVYRLYDFRNVAVSSFERDGGGSVLVELFDMGSAGDAYGIFTFYHEGKDLQLGDGGYLRPQLVCFWRGQYFVCVSPRSDPPVPDQLLENAARLIAARIPAGGSPPEWLKLFPTRDRRAQSLRYFHSHQALNYHCFVSEENVLRLNEKTECLLGSYRLGGRSFFQLWVRYPTTAAADAAYDFFMRMYSPQTWQMGVVENDDGTWAAAAKHESFIAAAFGLPSAAAADALRETTKHLLREAAKNLQREVEK